ncbi:carboxylic ester hydrolase-like isoform X2 [Bacillus rossius redtenbacheri]
MSEFVTVDIPQGRLRGKRVTSDATGVSYYSFQGIPYAKPPVGPLRFKPPEDPEPWTGTRDALAEGPICVQGDMFSGELVGDEDCLFLNVYTPQLATRSPKPVMVWIHGGKFSMGSGNTNLFGPDFLVAEEVVLVTINYRLGALGFLYLEGCDVTGNNGLRDQVMALKWVRDNIAQFGGDPGNVTIFGESAGGASVHYLTLSPLASGLFHRAIAQSGSVFIGGCNVPVGAANQRARRLARALGCRSEDPRQVAACLRSVPAEQLVADKAKARDNQELHGAILDQFFPSHETGPEAFLPDSPRRLLESGLFSKVPFITGVTSAEGKVKLFDSSYRLKFPEIDQNFTSVLPMELSDNLDVETCNEIANVVKKFYFGEKHLCEDTVAEFIETQVPSKASTLKEGGERGYCADAVGRGVRVRGPRDAAAARQVVAAARLRLPVRPRARAWVRLPAHCRRGRPRGASRRGTALLVPRLGVPRLPARGARRGDEGKHGQAVDAVRQDRESFKRRGPSYLDSSHKRKAQLLEDKRRFQNGDRHVQAKNAVLGKII